MSDKRSEVLQQILEERSFCPEIFLEEDGDWALEWYAQKMCLMVSISENGETGWVYSLGQEISHGTGVEPILKIINSEEFHNHYMNYMGKISSALENQKKSDSPQ